MSSPEIEGQPLDSSPQDEFGIIVDPELFQFMSTIAPKFSVGEENGVKILPTFIDAIPLLYGENERTRDDYKTQYEMMRRKISPLADAGIIEIKGVDGFGKMSTISRDDMISAISYLWVKAKMENRTRKLAHTYEAMMVTAGMWADSPRAKIFSETAKVLGEELKNRRKVAREKSNNYDPKGGDAPPTYWWGEKDAELPIKLSSVTLERVGQMIRTCNIMISENVNSTKEKELDLYFFQIDGEVFSVIQRIAEINRRVIGKEVGKRTNLEGFLEALQVVKGYLDKYSDKITNLNDLSNAISQTQRKS